MLFQPSQIASITSPVDLADTLKAAADRCRLNVPADRFARFQATFLALVHSDLSPLDSLDGFWDSELSIEAMLEPIVLNFARVTEHPKTGKLDCEISKKEITVGYSDLECLRECTAPVAIRIDSDFSVECLPTPAVVNGQRVIVFELMVAERPIGGTVNGQEDEMPF